MRVCVCLREREREKERGRQIERGRENYCRERMREGEKRIVERE